MNRRPICGYLDQNNVSFLCPNNLVIGKSSKEEPSYFNEDFQVRPRAELLQTIKAEFWKKLMNVLAADSKLMKYPCWYSQSRTPRVGDVVLILYKSKVQDSYKWGTIKEVHPNKRDITCKVSPIQSGKKGTFKNPGLMDIPVQRTVLLYSPDEETSSD